MSPVLLPLGFEEEIVERARRLLDDIPECDAAEISIVFQGQAPALRLVFGDPRLRARPLLMINLVAESAKNPLAPGRLLTGDEFRRGVREWVERYFKLQGVPITKRVSINASL